MIDNHQEYERCGLAFEASFRTSPLELLQEKAVWLLLEDVKAGTLLVYRLYRLCSTAASAGVRPQAMR